MISNATLVIGGVSEHRGLTKGITSLGPPASPPLPSSRRGVRSFPDLSVGALTPDLATAAAACHELNGV